MNRLTRAIVILLIVCVTVTYIPFGVYGTSSVAYGTETQGSGGGGSGGDGAPEENSTPIPNEVLNQNEEKLKIRATLKGDGTIQNPYEIWTAEDLRGVCENDPSCYILMNDIDLNGAEWRPIGYWDWYPFIGYFNGNGHVIRNFYVGGAGRDSWDTSAGGLFGFVEGRIENLGIENLGAVGIGNGTIVYKVPEKGLHASSYEYDSGKGGLPVGINFAGRAGGLAGVANAPAEIINCYYVGPVQGVGGTGGLIGMAYPGTVIENCCAIGNVNGATYFDFVWDNGATEAKIGFDKTWSVIMWAVPNGTGVIVDLLTGNVLSGALGFVDMLVTFPFDTLFNSEKDQSGRTNYVGGLIGVNIDGQVKDSYASANVSSNNAVFDGVPTGGLIGHNIGENNVSGCAYDASCSGISSSSLNYDVTKLSTVRDSKLFGNGGTIKGSWKILFGGFFVPGLSSIKNTNTLCRTITSLSKVQAIEVLKNTYYKESRVLLRTRPDSVTGTAIIRYNNSDYIKLYNNDDKNGTYYSIGKDGIAINDNPINSENSLFEGIEKNGESIGANYCTKCHELYLKYCDTNNNEDEKQKLLSQIAVTGTYQDGTERHPYHIHDLDSMITMQDNKESHFLLCSDVDFEVSKEIDSVNQTVQKYWWPVGRSHTSPFKGSLKNNAAFYDGDSGNEWNLSGIEENEDGYDEFDEYKGQEVYAFKDSSGNEENYIAARPVSFKNVPTIKNLKVQTYKNAGLFACLRGQVSGIKVQLAEGESVSTIGDTASAGAIAGDTINGAVIENCIIVDSNIFNEDGTKQSKSMSTVLGSNKAGGIAGVINRGVVAKNNKTYVNVSVENYTMRFQLDPKGHALKIASYVTRIVDDAISTVQNALTIKNGLDNLRAKKKKADAENTKRVNNINEQVDKNLDSKYEEATAERKNALDNLDKTIEEYANNLNLKTSYNVGLSKQKKDKEIDLQGIEKELDDLYAALNKMPYDKVEAVNKYLSDFKDDSAKAEAKLAELKRDVDSFAKNRGEGQNSIYLVLKERYDECEKAVKIVQKKKEKTNAENAIANYTTQLEETKKEIDSINATIEDKKKDYEQNKADLDNEKINLEKEKKDIKANIAELCSANAAVGLIIDNSGGSYSNFVKRDDNGELIKYTDKNGKENESRKESQYKIFYDHCNDVLDKSLNSYIGNLKSGNNNDQAQTGGSKDVKAGYWNQLTAFKDNSTSGTIKFTNGDGDEKNKKYVEYNFSYGEENEKKTAVFKIDITDSFDELGLEGVYIKAEDEESKKLTDILSPLADVYPAVGELLEYFFGAYSGIFTGQLWGSNEGAKDYGGLLDLSHRCLTEGLNFKHGATFGGTDSATKRGINANNLLNLYSKGKIEFGEDVFCGKDLFSNLEEVQVDSISNDGVVSASKKTYASTTAFAGGSGTKNDPYIITNMEHLRNVKYFYKSAYYYKLGANIDMSNYYNTYGEYWTPIGTDADYFAFEGVFDGDHKTISNLQVHSSGAGGLFGYCAGTIKDLTMENVIIDTTGMSAGGIAAELCSGGLIVDCKVTGSIGADGKKTSKIISPGRVGGIVGISHYGSVINKVTVDENVYIGNEYVNHANTAEDAGQGGAAGSDTQFNGIASWLDKLLGIFPQVMSIAASFVGGNAGSGVAGILNGVIDSASESVANSYLANCGRVIGLHDGKLLGFTADTVPDTTTYAVDAEPNIGKVFTHKDDSVVESSEAMESIPDRGAHVPEKIKIDGKDVYKITNANELAYVTYGTCDDYILMNDIYLQPCSEIGLKCGEKECDKKCVDWDNWAPLCRERDQCFEGDFNGNGHTIYGLDVHTDEAGGLFGYILGDVHDLKIAVKDVDAYGPAGGLAAAVLYPGSVERCAVVPLENMSENDITGGANDDGAGVGGLVGIVGKDASVSDSYAHMDVDNANFMKHIDWRENNSYNVSMSIVSQGVSASGGVYDFVKNDLGDIRAGNKSAGDLVNTFIDLIFNTVLDPIVEAAVKPIFKNNERWYDAAVGGLVGELQGNVYNSFAYSSVTKSGSTKNDNIGNLVGRVRNAGSNGENGKIECSYYKVANNKEGYNNNGALYEDNSFKSLNHSVEANTAGSIWVKDAKFICCHGKHSVLCPGLYALKDQNNKDVLKAIEKECPEGSQDGKGDKKEAGFATSSMPKNENPPTNNSEHEPQIVSGFNLLRNDNSTEELSTGNSGFDGGDGTSQNPFIISTGEQFMNMYDSQYNNHNKYFKIADGVDVLDLGAIDYAGKAGLAYYSEDEQLIDMAFKGNFDGSGCTIKYIIPDLNLNDSTISGLFPVLKGSVKNMAVKAQILDSDAEYAGAVAGIMLEGASVQNTAVASGTQVGGELACGGIAGRVDGDVTMSDIHIDSENQQQIRITSLNSECKKGVIAGIVIQGKAVNLTKTFISFDPDADEISKISLFGEKANSSYSSDKKIFCMVDGIFESYDNPAGVSHINSNNVTASLSTNWKFDGIPCLKDMSYRNGSGTEDNPFIIRNADDFANITDGEKDDVKYYIQTEDFEIDQSHVVMVAENISYDGDGHTIVAKNANGGNIFGRLQDSTFKNCTVKLAKGCSVGANGGIVADYAVNSLIFNCTVDNSELVETSLATNAGNVVGSGTSSEIVNCLVTKTKKPTGENEKGMFFGTADDNCNILNCAYGTAMVGTTTDDHDGSVLFDLDTYDLILAALNLGDSVGGELKTQMYRWSCEPSTKHVVRYKSGYKNGATVILDAPPSEEELASGNIETYNTVTNETGYELKKPETAGISVQTHDDRIKIKDMYWSWPGTNINCRFNSGDQVPVDATIRIEAELVADDTGRKPKQIGWAFNNRLYEKSEGELSSETVISINDIKSYLQYNDEGKNIHIDVFDREDLSVKGISVPKKPKKTLYQVGERDVDLAGGILNVEHTLQGENSGRTLVTPVSMAGSHNVVGSSVIFTDSVYTGDKEEDVRVSYLCPYDGQIYTTYYKVCVSQNVATLEFAREPKKLYTKDPKDITSLTLDIPKEADFGLGWKKAIQEFGEGEWGKMSSQLYLSVGYNDPNVGYRNICTEKYSEFASGEKKFSFIDYPYGSYTVTISRFIEYDMKDIEGFEINDPWAVTYDIDYVSPEEIKSVEYNGLPEYMFENDELYFDNLFTVTLTGGRTHNLSSDSDYISIDYDEVRNNYITGVGTRKYRDCVISLNLSLYEYSTNHTIEIVPKMDSANLKETEITISKGDELDDKLHWTIHHPNDAFENKNSTVEYPFGSILGSNSISSDSIIIGDFDNTEKGTYDVTVYSKRFKTSGKVKINVVPAEVVSMKVIENPLKRQYVEKSGLSDIDLTGAKVEIEYANGYKDTVTLPHSEVKPSSMREKKSGRSVTEMVNGTQVEVILGHAQTENVNTSFSVDVVPKSIKKIEVCNANYMYMGQLLIERTESYFNQPGIIMESYVKKGEKLRGILRLVYDNGEIGAAFFDDEGVSVNGFDKNTVGTYDNITISYGGFTVKYPATVKVTEPLTYGGGMQNVYPKGITDINREGGYLWYVHETGEREKISMTDTGVTVTYPEGTFASTGEKTVNISYDDYTISQTIKVVDRLAWKEGCEIAEIYEKGDPLDMSGKLTYTDDMGISRDVSMNKVTISGYDSSTPGEKTLTITYQDAVMQQKVYVADDKIYLDVDRSTPRDYAIGDTLSLEEIKININSFVNKNKFMEQYTMDSAAFEVTGFDSQTKGQKTITVRYIPSDLSVSYTINVHEISGIKMEMLPDNTQYGLNDQLDLTGAKIKAEYGPVFKVIDLKESNEFASRVQKNTVGAQVPVTVTHEDSGLTTTFNISVSEPQEAADMYIEGNGTANLGEQPDLSSVKVTVYYKGGNYAKFAGTDPRFTINGFDSGKLGQQNVKLAYAAKNLEAPLIINYGDNSQWTLIQKPTKLTYQEGESICLDGGRISRTKADGTTEVKNLEDINCTVRGYLPFKTTGQYKQNVVIEYEGSLMGYDVQVNARQDRSVTDKTIPADLGTQFKGEDINFLVGIKYGDDILHQVPYSAQNAVTVSGYDKNKTGTQQVTLNLGAGQTITRNVIVKEVKSISVNEPSSGDGILFYVDPSEHKYDFGQQTVRVTYTDNTTEDIKLSSGRFRITGLDTSEYGEQQCTVETAGKEAEFTVSGMALVIDEVSNAKTLRGNGLHTSASVENNLKAVMMKNDGGTSFPNTRQGFVEFDLSYLADYLAADESLCIADTQMNVNSRTQDERTGTMYVAAVADISDWNALSFNTNIGTGIKDITLGQVIGDKWNVLQTASDFSDRVESAVSDNGSGKLAFRYSGAPRGNSKVIPPIMYTAIGQDSGTELCVILTQEQAG